MLITGFFSVGTKSKVDEEEEEDDGQSSEISDTELPDDEGSEPVLQVRTLMHEHVLTTVKHSAHSHHHPKRKHILVYKCAHAPYDGLPKHKSNNMKSIMRINSNAHVPIMAFSLVLYAPKGLNGLKVTSRREKSKPPA